MARNKKSDIEILAEGLDGSNVQRAHAIATFVDGRLADALMSIRKDVQASVATQAANIRAAGELSEGERAAVADVVDEATEKVNAAADQADALADQLADGQEVNPEDIAEAEAAAEEARVAVDGVSQTLEARVATLERRVDGHQKDITALNARVDQVQACANESLSVSARALAVAYTAGGGEGRWARASRLALAVFGVVLVLYFLLAVLTPLDWTLRDQFAWPFGFAAVAFWLGLVYFDEYEDELEAAETVAEAEVSVRSA